MERLRRFILISIIALGIVFLLIPQSAPDNFFAQEVLGEIENSDVIIIFNAGGWGDAQFEECQDFAPIIKRIQKTLSNWGQKSTIIPYTRAEDNFFGKISAFKEFLSSFDKSSEYLAEKIDDLARSMPGKKIIVAGLSNGATFVDKTYDKISQDLKNSVYGLALGAPFWSEAPSSEKFLSLNNPDDYLARGDVGSLLKNLVRSSAEWVFSKATGYNSKFSKHLHLSGHDYLWSSSEVGPQIMTFLEKNFKQ